MFTFTLPVRSKTATTMYRDMGMWFWLEQAEAAKLA